MSSKRSANWTVGLFVCLGLCLGVHAQIDRTREEGGKGSTLVEAVLAELHDACIYPEDGHLLRRVAYVETGDGTEPATYTMSGYNGGIWGVDQTMLQRTQREKAQLGKQYALIHQKLGINWSSVTWTDMRKPLYSALAAAMILTLEGAPDNVPVSIASQATYWLTHFRKGQGTHTTQEFIGPASTLQKTCARTENMDVVFLVNTERSVGPGEWTALKKLVGDVIIRLSLDNGLGQDQDRVSMITFSDKATVSFGLQDGVDLVTVMSLINNATYVPGSTNFTAAFTTAQNEVFNTARPNVAKVAILISGGADSKAVAMVMSLMALKLADVTFFTVGVGSEFDEQQLQQIASDPTCSHFYRVTSYQQLPDLRMAMERISCRVPVVLSSGDFTYPCGFNVMAQLKGGSLGTAITVTVDYGSVDLFGSYTTQMPSADMHDVSYTTDAGTPYILYTRDPRPLTLNLQSQTSQGLRCNGNFTVSVNIQGAKLTDCNKRKPDLVFLIDATLAKTDADWTAMLTFMQTFTQQFDVTANGAHVALVSFADTQTTHFRLGNHSSNADVLQTLRNISRPQGSTSADLSEALAYVNNQILSSGSRTDASKTLILVTSGTVKNATSAMAQASAVHRLGVRVVVVVIGGDVDQTTLEAIASGTQHLQRVSDVSSLMSVVGNVTQKACGAVTVLCVEGGINRECHIEDIINTQYGHVLGPEQNISPNPCALQLAIGEGGLRLERFPHPKDQDKFLLCDSSGQAYVVRCPSTQLYVAVAHECRHPSAGGVTHPAVTTQQTTPRTSHPTTRVNSGLPVIYPFTTTTTTTTTATATPSQGHFTNPCTPEMVSKGVLFHPYPHNPTLYFHCGSMPYTGQLQSCPQGKVWMQDIMQCVTTGVEDTASG